MAVNTSRSMQAELEQGLRDNTYMQLQPDWSINSNPPTDRMSWPTYRQVLQHQEAPDHVLRPISRRESPPPGGMYHTKQGGGSGLLSDLNAGGGD